MTKHPSSTDAEARHRVVILGAGGRDFHVFNTRYRHDPSTEVVAFTAAQIPHIEERRYPPVLSGALYPEGIPVEPESRLEDLIRKHSVDEAVWWFITMERSCQVQLLAEAAGSPVLIDPEMAKLTSGQVGSPLAGWFSFQPLYERIVREQPDLLD